MQAFFLNEINYFRLKFHVIFNFRYHRSSVLIQHITFATELRYHLSLPVAFLRFIVLPWQLLMVDGNGLLHPRGKTLTTITLMHFYSIFF
jgi:hypothetical protein